MTRNSPSKADRSPPSAYGRTDGDSSSRRGRKGGSSRRSSSRSRSRSRSPNRSRNHRGGSSGSSRKGHSHRSHKRHGRSRSRERSRRDRSPSGSRSHRRSRSGSGSRSSGRESHRRSSPTERTASAGGVAAPPLPATSLASKTPAATADAPAVPQAPTFVSSMAAPSALTSVPPPGVSAALAAARAAAVRSGLMPADALNAPPPQLPSSLPSYYNPTAVNPLKYSEQMLKRKLLWKKPQEEATAEADEPPSKPSSTCAKVWEGMTFAQDDDGKVTAKFRKLMGIRGEPPPPAEKPNPAASSLLKQQEKLFHDLDQQYEAARVSTHTHRGVGLGYSSQMATFFQPANLNTSGK